MHSLWRKLIKTTAIVALAITGGNALAAGLLTPANSQLEQLQIKQHHVAVTIEDGYAITTIEQTFYNPHPQTLEAIYTFPVPEQAAVSELTYWIDGQAVTGEVVEKQQARQIYEEQKAQGQQTALTEQDDYRSFDTSVYPVPANDSVKIRLAYIQPVHADLGVGRYVYPLQEGGVDEQRIAFWHIGDEVSEAFSFTLTMRSAYPIADFRLPQHPQALVQKLNDHEWQVSIANQAATNTGDEQANNANAGYQPTRLDQDIMVYWRHQAGLPGSIDLVTHKPDPNGRGTFMLTVTPGDDLQPALQGRDWVMVLDISGSMQGKFTTLAQGVTQGLAKLRPDDRFKIIVFNEHSREITSGFTPVTAANIAHYSELLQQLQPQDGTNLYAGIAQGLKGLDADRPSALLLVTDGVANVGVTEKKKFMQLLSNRDVRLFTFIMGNSANRPLLQEMTKVSNGFAMAISTSDDIAGRLLQAADKLSHQAWRDISLSIKGVKTADLTPANIGTLYRGQQLIVLGHYWGDGDIKLALSGDIGDQRKTYSSSFALPASSNTNPELERLWAYATVENLQAQIDYLGENPDSRQAIVDIATEHGLVTNYTSMLVVREEVFKQLGLQRHNAQRLAIEQQAQQTRRNAPVASRRVDSQQPAFSSNSAQPGSGGGALGPWTLVLLLPLLWASKRQR